MEMNSDLEDVESLTLCNFCKQKFNTTDLLPKILLCKHYFCQKCIETTMIKGQEISCVHCWKQQGIEDGGASSLPTYSAVLALANHLTTLHFNDKESKKDAPACTVHGQSWTLWCHNCRVPLCRMCYLLIDHCDHNITSHAEALEFFVTNIKTELNASLKLHQEIQKLSAHQREFQLHILEACVNLKTALETDIATPSTLLDSNESLLCMLTKANELVSPAEAQLTFVNAVAEKLQLEKRYQELTQKSKIEDAISTSCCLLDFASVAAIQTSDSSVLGPISPGMTVSNPATTLLLANYCLSKVFSSIASKPIIPLRSLQLFSPIPNRYYFNIDCDQISVGRFVIETQPEIAPLMSRNFEALCLGENGYSYRNCSVFQCWPGQSIITGDYENNNGRGGRSIYEEASFMPDDSQLAAVRGSVGMRRSQKRHDNLGLVGSQFRIILHDTPMFSAIFGHVVEGIDIVDTIASCGDHIGKPTKSIVISSCGRA